MEKSTIFLSQYWKNSHFESVPNFFLLFGCTINIFVDCMPKGQVPNLRYLEKDDKNKERVVHRS